MHLISLATSCDNTCEMQSTREAHQGLSAQGFDWRLVTQAPSDWQIPKFQTPKKESRCSAETHCLYKQFRHNEPPLSISSGNGGNPPENQVPRCPPRDNLVSRPFKVRSAMILFLHRCQSLAWASTNKSCPDVDERNKIMRLL